MLKTGATLERSSFPPDNRRFIWNGSFQYESTHPFTASAKAQGGRLEPIIFIMGYGDLPTTVQAVEAGASEFLTSPFNDGVLLTAIRALLERSRICS